MKDAAGVLSKVVENGIDVAEARCGLGSLRDEIVIDQRDDTGEGRG